MQAPRSVRQWLEGVIQKKAVLYSIGAYAGPRREKGESVIGEAESEEGEARKPC